MGVMSVPDVTGGGETISTTSNVTEVAVVCSTDSHDCHGLVMTK